MNHELIIKIYEKQERKHRTTWHRRLVTDADFRNLESLASDLQKDHESHRSQSSFSHIFSRAPNIRRNVALSQVHARHERLEVCHFHLPETSPKFRAQKNIARVPRNKWCKFVCLVL